MSGEPAAESRAAFLRFQALLHDRRADHLRFAASAVLATAAARRLVEAMQAGYDAEVVKHPDLAELNVIMDGFYATDYEGGQEA